jgi:hypothetical protein
MMKYHKNEETMLFTDAIAIHLRTSCNFTAVQYMPRAANYCRTSDNVRLNLANVRAKVILIGHWTDHKKNCHIIHFFAVTKSDCKFTQFAVCNKIYEAF